MEIRTPGMEVFRFGVFELDARSGELRRHGLKVRFPDQSFQILKLLLSRPGDVVTRDEPDAYGRFRVRLDEMWESLKIV